MEDTSEFLPQIISFIRRNILLAALFSGALISLIVGLIQILGHKSSEIKFQKAQVTRAGEESYQVAQNRRNTAQIKVDISGEVAHPGVYSLSSDARVEDAIKAAGGFSQNANRDFVTKRLNLAQKVSDGAKIYIPGMDEKDITVLSSQSSVSSDNISVNTATLADLDRLPGVGAVTAQKIVDNRPYQTLDELLLKKVLTKRVFENIKTKLSL